MTPDLIESSIDLAAKWQTQANARKSAAEIEFTSKMAKMVKAPANKVFLTELIDQSFRPNESKRIAEQVAFLLKKYPNIDLFKAYEKVLIKLFLNVGRYIPQVSVPAMISQIRSQTSSVILDGDKTKLRRHIEKRQEANIGINLNIIGEAILGEEEARERIDIYKEALSRPEVTYISIKISTIYSQISSIAFQYTIGELVKRLSILFQCAMDHPYKNDQGEEQAKFINLDMEEYRDLPLTVEAFKKTLDLPQFKKLKAGIVLQAYLPDSIKWHQDLIDWARKRVDSGGSPIKMRLVKGANMDMEKTEASSKHWPQAPYHEKLDSDANYKRILRTALKPENAECIHLGIASHNLFELAHAHLLAKELGTTKYVTIEMLEGMADSAAQTLHDDGVPLLLYAPVATRENFTHAIAYYVRRLDENTSPQNFLTHAFDLEPGNDDWNYLAVQFRASFDRIDTVASESFRIQNRLTEENREDHSTLHNDRFFAEPDTDFTLQPNRQWARKIVEDWKTLASGPAEKIPIVVGDEDLYEGLETKEVLDYSREDEKVTIARYALATEDHIEKALEIADQDESGWGAMSHEDRHVIISKAAQKLREARANLIGVAAAEVGKLFTETDVEISEAIDFAEFYPYSHRKLWKRDNIKLHSKGVGVVIPPWNFPIAIPAGGVIASLVAGNNTILKPAPQSTYCAWLICKALWEAGVPKKALQFLPCRNMPEAGHLVKHPKTEFVIFTGSTQTAFKMLETRPRLHLFAETGGKNATIVSSVSDRDKVITDVIQSAFSNTGQKCSATSLLLLHRPLYENKKFRAALVDAARSLPMGNVWDLSTKYGPLTNPVGGALKESLEQLDHGEKWALKPEVSETNPRLISPGILWDVSQKSYCYQNELFGPVLGVMPYDTMEEAIRLVNETNFGLTSGLQSLDEREVELWRESIRAGNLYINRGTTGAIVLRQPFGGMEKSAIGPGIKVGGHNYTLEFSAVEETGLPENRDPHAPALEPFLPLLESYPEAISDDEATQIRAAWESACYEYATLFSKTEDYFQVRGETNQNRYLRMKSIVVRVEPGDSPFSVLSRLFCAHIAGSQVYISASLECPDELRTWLKLKAPQLDATYQQDTQQDLARDIRKYERLRFANPDRVSDYLALAAANEGVYIASDPPLIDGRLELVLYFREQSVSHQYHRYGNLGQHQLNPNAEKPDTPGELE